MRAYLVSADLDLRHHVRGSDVHDVVLRLLPAFELHALVLVLPCGDCAGWVAAGTLQAAAGRVQTAAVDVEKVLHKVQELQARACPPLQKVRHVRVADGPSLSLDKQLHRILQSLVLPPVCLLDPRSDRVWVCLLHAKAVVGLQNKEFSVLLHFAR